MDTKDFVDHLFSEYEETLELRDFKAIWIFAAGLFILLGFIIGFKFSWLVFIFAVAVQLAAQSMMTKPRS
ncbi:hypothetical protein LQZ21_08910 [Treponema sp. TIM-1]|uniref:hypothetical protein n=1 Tax=Treponema sp. TIM-1 TaxID=2898417 RepID=UPI0039812AA6